MRKNRLPSTFHWKVHGCCLRSNMKLSRNVPRLTEAHWGKFEFEWFSTLSAFSRSMSHFFLWAFFQHFPLNSFAHIFSNCRDIPEDVLNTYCWIHSTYTVVDAFMKKQGLEVPFPGIDNSQGGRGPLTIKHNKYYQWVAFTLFFQVSLVANLLCTPFYFVLNQLDLGS